MSYDYNNPHDLEDMHPANEARTEHEDARGDTQMREARLGIIDNPEDPKWETAIDRVLLVLQSDRHPLLRTDEGAQT